jgi:hypothetical protein
MILQKSIPALLIGLFVIGALSCHKDHDEPPPKPYPKKQVIYSVKGSNFILNYIDSNSAFQSNQAFQGSFDYTFQKAPGSPIGITVSLASPADSITSWEIYIDGKLYANAYSPGGAYMLVPYEPF